jgi:hypothetical protein
MLCGDPGATKSFLLLEAAAFWQEFDVKWAIFQLEEDLFFHIKRAYAQRLGDGRITDHEWAEQNAEQIREWRKVHRAWEMAFTEHLTEAPDDNITLEGLASWVEQRAQAGYEIIVADPITAVDSGKEPWDGERKFLLKVKSIARKYWTRIVLVTHPTKDSVKRQFGASKMAGSTNFARFTQTILWVERCEEPETLNVRQMESLVQQSVTANRKLHLLKTRNSVGAGLSLAFNFDSRSLRFSELGIIVPDHDV